MSKILLAMCMVVCGVRSVSHLGPDDTDPRPSGRTIMFEIRGRGLWCDDPFSTWKTRPRAQVPMVWDEITAGYSRAYRYFVC